MRKIRLAWAVMLIVAALLCLSACGESGKKSAVTGGNAAADGQPKPQTVGGRIHPFGVAVAVKQGGEKLLGDARTGIQNGQLHRMGCDFYGHRYGAALRRELERIG